MTPRTGLRSQLRIKGPQGRRRLYRRFVIGSSIIMHMSPICVFALKFRPKTEEEPDRHTGYFMSEKECILQHRGSLATIYQELKNYAEEHKIIFTKVVHAVCNPSIALIPLTKFLDRLRIVSSCQIGGHGVLTSSSTIRVAWRSHPARA